MKTIIKTAGYLDQVLNSCKQIGGRDQPRTSTLTVAALSEMRERLQQMNEVVFNTRADYRHAVWRRQESFAGLSTLAVRVTRLASSSGISAEQLAGLNAIKNQLIQTGKKKHVAAPEAGNTANVERRSPRRRTFEMRTQCFADLVHFIVQLEKYNPVEGELSVGALKAKLVQLVTQSEAVVKTQAEYDRATISRRAFITGAGGVLETLTAVKDYIRGAFGSTSGELKMITKG